MKYGTDLVSQYDFQGQLSIRPQICISIDIRIFVSHFYMFKYGKKVLKVKRNYVYHDISLVTSGKKHLIKLMSKVNLNSAEFHTLIITQGKTVA